MRNLQNHIRPGNVQNQQQRQQAVENVVGREHGQNAWRLHGTTVDDARIEAEPRDDPDDGEEGEYAIAEFLVVGVLGELGRLWWSGERERERARKLSNSFLNTILQDYLQENIRTIVHDQHQRPNAMQIANPAEGQQQQCDHVMDEHLPKVLALDVEELGDGQRPVEGH